MKKIAFSVFFIIFFLSTVSHSAWCQSSLLFEGGYMFPLAGGLLNPYLNSMTTNPDRTPNIYGSWGKGVVFGVEFDHKFTKYIDLELGATYRYGSSINYSDTIGGLTNVANDRLHFFEFSIGDVYDFRCTGSFVPYLGSGATFAVDDNISIEETSNDTYGNTTIFNSSLTCEPAFGAYGKIGAIYHLSSTFLFFGEIRIDVLSLTPKELFTNSVTQNGNNITNTLMPYQQETEYLKSISPHVFSQFQPLEEIAQPLPTSSWGINMGIVFNFGTVPSTKK
jgi:hypothetical protein